MSILINPDFKCAMMRLQTNLLRDKQELEVLSLDNQDLQRQIDEVSAIGVRVIDKLSEKKDLLNKRVQKLTILSAASAFIESKISSELEVLRKDHNDLTQRHKDVKNKITSIDPKITNNQRTTSSNIIVRLVTHIFYALKNTFHTLFFGLNKQILELNSISSKHKILTAKIEEKIKHLTKLQDNSCKMTKAITKKQEQIQTIDECIPQVERHFQQNLSELNILSSRISDSILAKKKKIEVQEQIFTQENEQFLKELVALLNSRPGQPFYRLSASRPLLLQPAAELIRSARLSQAVPVKLPQGAGSLIEKLANKPAAPIPNIRLALTDLNPHGASSHKKTSGLAESSQLPPTTDHENEPNEPEGFVKALVGLAAGLWGFFTQQPPQLNTSLSGANNTSLEPGFPSIDSDDED